jgi:predicted TPR repeat methyltransferase
MEPSSASERDVTVGEAMQMALTFQQRGQLAEAEKIYERVLEVAPDHPDIVHFYGVLLHQLGRSDEAIATIRRSLELEPDRAECYNNLGIILRAKERYDEAAEAYARAVELDPQHANAYNNLGVLRRFTGKPAEAEAAYRKAIELNPNYSEAYHNLGVLLSGQKRHREAILCFFKVLAIEPQRTDDRRLLAIAYCELGERDKAIEVFEKWLKEDPANPVARHMLAAVSGRDVPPRASDAYVESSFDAFAESFERKLEQLSYRAPRLIGMALEGAGRPPEGALDVLDAGCGTGLCGPHIKPYARRLVGVDLSGGMLSKARQKDIYDELVKGELTAFLRSQTAAFDIIVSADTLVYFGRLDEVSHAAFAALRPGGLLIFTVEELVSPPEGVEFRIETHGRYSHSQHYVARVLDEAGFDTEIAHADLRTESALPVAGLVVRAMKPHGSPRQNPS